jgi:hypothetical protein
VFSINPWTHVSSAQNKFLFDFLIVVGHVAEAVEWQHFAGVGVEIFELVPAPAPGIQIHIKC